MKAINRDAVFTAPIPYERGSVEPSLGNYKKFADHVNYAEVTELVVDQEDNSNS